jgi:hypothetical protein
MSDLVTRYIMGEIRDTHWSRFMEVLDSDTLIGADREAFAVFFADCLDDVGDGDVFLPVVTEAEDVVGTSRMAA